MVNFRVTLSYLYVVFGVHALKHKSFLCLFNLKSCTDFGLDTSAGLWLLFSSRYKVACNLIYLAVAQHNFPVV